MKKYDIYRKAFNVAAWTSTAMSFGMFRLVEHDNLETAVAWWGVSMGSMAIAALTQKNDEPIKNSENNLEL
ncbi:MAG: hypothetical protein AAF182_03060 [Pseudomonadota bacterium]